MVAACSRTETKLMPHVSLHAKFIATLDENDELKEKVAELKAEIVKLKQEKEDLREAWLEG